MAARKREGRVQKEKRGPPGSEAGNVIETHDHAGEEFPIRLPFGLLWYGGPNAVSNAIGYAKFRNRSHDAPVSI